MEAAIKIRAQLVELQPDNARYRNNLADSCFNLGHYVRDPTQALAVELLQQSVAILERLTESYPDRIRYRSALAYRNYRLGDLMYNQIHDLDGAPR